MSKELPDIITIYNDNPEWTSTDFKEAVRVDVLPQSLQKKLRGHSI